MTSASTYVRLTSSGGVLEARGFCISEFPLYTVGGIGGIVIDIDLPLSLHKYIVDSSTNRHMCNNKLVPLYGKVYRSDN